MKKDLFTDFGILDDVKNLPLFELSLIHEDSYTILFDQQDGATRLFPG